MKAGNPKSEIRNKSEIHKKQTANKEGRSRGVATVSRIAYWFFRYYFGFRISDFGFCCMCIGLFALTTSVHAVLTHDSVLAIPRLSSAPILDGNVETRE